MNIHWATVAKQQLVAK